MAQQHVNQDLAVCERRLRPIYDNLEVGNNRKALQETEKVLKKNPNMLCARALKGLSLLRLGRYEESHTILQAVAGGKPVDDSTLQVLSFCYKELEQLDKIVELYAYAVKQTPGNEELLAHLFISHVRMEDFKSQQAVALQLYKAHPKSAYYFWAVMSVVLQAIRGPESNNPEKRKIFLALAQRMVDKHIKEDKLESEQEVFLFLHILKLQQKFKEALDFLQGAVCEKLYPGAPVYMKIELMKELKLWQDINDLLKELLREDRDRWDYYKDYLSSCFELLTEKNMKDTAEQQSSKVNDCSPDVITTDGTCEANGKSAELSDKSIQEETALEGHNKLPEINHKNAEADEEPKQKDTQTATNNSPSENQQTSENNENPVKFNSSETNDKSQAEIDIATPDTLLNKDKASVMSIGEKRPNSADNCCVLRALDDCHDFLCQLIESTERKVRGPYLARLELHKRMREHKMDAQALLGDFSELVIEYFRLFGDKSCCTHDIALFLSSISMGERQELASKLLLESGINSTTLPQNKEQMQKHICALQISRICGSHIDMKVEHLLAFYTALKLHYEHGLSSFGKNLLHTDMGPSDPYALLAANVMYDISLQEQKSNRLFEALCLLQYVLRNSTSNFHVKLLSLKIYHILGCMLGAQEMYDYLDIKQIQLDSMGYIHCSLLPLSGRFSMARSIFDTTLKFFTNSYKERLEYIALTYRFCTFSKLEEFMNFKERLTNSLHYVATTVEAQLCDLVMLYGNSQQNLATYMGMSVQPADDRISWHELSDNRDLSAIVRWDPEHLVNSEEERKDSFDQELELLQVRSLLLRLVASFVDLFHPPPTWCGTKMATANSHANESSSGSSSSAAEAELHATKTVELLRDSWKGLFYRLRMMKCTPLCNRFLVNLLPTRLHLMLIMPYEHFFTELAQLVIALYVGASELPIQCKVVSDHVNSIVELLASTIKESDEATEDGLWRRREWQNKVAACLEMLSLFTFVLSVFQEKFQTPAKYKPRKKTGAANSHDPGRQVVSEKERCLLLSELARHLAKKLQTCETLIRNWKIPVLPRDLNSFMADMSLKPEVEAVLIGDVASIFKESHELMVTEMKNLIKDKLRMLTIK